MNYLMAFLMGIALVSAGCNTVEGVGKDVEAGGAKVQDGARAVKEKL